MCVMQRQYYLWTASGLNISVAFAPAFMKRLKQSASNAGSVDSAEIGGILLGIQQSDDRITVEDFELLPSEHRRGATFTLSQADRKKLAQRLRASHQGLQPVGSFRTHLRQGLYMDQYDFELMSNHFGGSSDVMLLLRPKDWQAGVFAWEDGAIRRQKSYREFAFDPAVLPLTPIPLGESAEAIEPPKPAPVPALRKVKPSSVIARVWLPTLAKVGLVAATFGLVGVLAHYAHEHRSPVPLVARVQASQTPPDGAVQPPFDPEISASHTDLDEMHVKLSSADARPSPFSQPGPPAKSELISPAKPANTVRSEMPPQPAAPSAPPAIESAANLPPAIVGPLLLKPSPPPVVSVVSLEPAEPGILSRGINHVPVLNLLQRHKYKAGDSFSPARPVRQVKPRLPADLQPESGSPPPVDVKVWIDKSGQVTRAELLSENTESDIAEIASRAALKWTFEPARLSDRPVSSELVMHFRFQAKQSY